MYAPVASCLPCLSRTLARLAPENFTSTIRSVDLFAPRRVVDRELFIDILRQSGTRLHPPPPTVILVSSHPSERQILRHALEDLSFPIASLQTIVLPTSSYRTIATLTGALHAIFAFQGSFDIGLGNNGFYDLPVDS
jgi:hypothetical protein